MMAEKRDEMLARRSKMLRWREKGGNYPNTFRRVGLASELAKEFGEKNKDELVQVNFETSFPTLISVARRTVCFNSQNRINQ